jgi:F-type H+-transporting ATPase subunit a
MQASPPAGAGVFRPGPAAIAGLASFAEPKLVMPPFEIVANVTPVFSVTVCRFGNVASGAWVIVLAVAFVCLSCASLGATALAKSDPWTGCGGADPDVRIASCTEIITAASRKTKQNKIAAYINRGGAYRAKGDFGRAIADLDAALRLDPRSAAALIERASVYHAKGDLDRSLADYDRAIAARPQSAAAFYGRGEVYRAKDDLDRAIADYERALRLDTNLAAAYGSRAKAYRGTGDLDRALADFNEALKLDPRSASLLVDRGTIYRSKGALDQAIADYSAAIERDPDLVSARYNRGLAFSAKGDFDKAIVDFSKAIELDPELAEVFLDRANAYRGKQDLDHAKHDLESALRLDPQLASAKEALEELNKLVVQSATPPIAAPPTAPAAPAAKASSDRQAHASPLESKTLFHIGPVPITTPVVATWAIMLVLSVGSRLATRRLQLQPDRRQAVLEIIVTGIMVQIEDIIRKDSRPFLPLLGTLFIFLVSANLSGVLPGGEAPTSKLETPAALALIVFFSVHFFGVRARGPLGYLASFAEPKLIMLPLNIVSEVTRTFSLMVRLFGNVMSGEFVIALVVGLAGLFVPIPLMVLEILVGIVQAYIFTVLATVFIGAAIGSVEKG